MIRKLKKIFICIIILILIMMLFIISISSKTYAKAEAGDIIYLPNYIEHPQYGGNVECDLDNINWKYNCKKLYDIWCGFGKPTNEIDLCYLNVAGVDWIFIAVAETFGTVGDYLKVHIKEADTGKEIDYYMMVFDTKSKKDKNAYFVNGVHYGHAQPKLDILEFPWHGSARKSVEFRKKMKNVIYIQNGGNYFENPNGPVGFSAVPTIEYETDTESSTLTGVIVQTARNIWNAINTFIDNHVEKDNKSTSLFNLYDEFEGGNLVWPVPGHTRVSSGFGPRKAPTAGATTNHRGIDIPAREGVLEVASGTGIIKEAGQFSRSTGYRCYLYLDDTQSFGGEVILGYLHSSPTPLVKAGDHVTAGQQITTVGPMYVTVPGYGRVTNGVMTGTHLHFSMRINGEYVDPEKYLPKEMRK